LYNATQKYLVTDLTLDRITYLAAEAGGYRFNAGNIYSVPGTTKMGSIYEEYYVDEEALRDLIIRLFFKQI
ncbi:MAG: LytR family transcriptional regulator, partial [Lachnospiraceae bacterium]|nr:LytR family transcriptional regulator [Lachnospiraceae bacterium]